MDGLVAAREIRLFELSLNISASAPVSSPEYATLPTVIDQTCISSVNVTDLVESVSHIGITPMLCRRRPIPIIAVTAQLECDFRQKCINAGMQVRMVFYLQFTFKLVDYFFVSFFENWLFCVHRISSANPSREQNWLKKWTHLPVLQSFEFLSG